MAGTSEICKCCKRPMAGPNGLCDDCEDKRQDALRDEAEDRQAREERQDLEDRNRLYIDSALSEKARKP